jgi:diguanylate cyclase (GGDEF)-like protein
MSFQQRQENPENITERLITRAYAMVADAERLIAEQREKIRQLETLSYCDGLTGLLNRRGFEAALKRELAAVGRTAHSEGTLILIDLDGFKRVNDSYGHAAGDAYLIEVADFLRMHCRPNDVIARLGGDEFVIILPITRIGPGRARAKSLLAKLNQAHMIWHDRALSLRASHGAAEYGPGSQVEATLQEADAALYIEKNRRRESVTP